MKPSHIEHIGIAVSNLEEAMSFYEKVLGLTCYNIEEVADQKVRTAFFQVGQTKIELLQSTDPTGPIGKFIEKKGEGIHHIAFSGIALIDCKPRKGAEGLDIAFLHPKATGGVLIELCEKKEPPTNQTSK
jgi:methylmalonyl-CoA/ethylmalonyl-CoA epimerase